MDLSFQLYSARDFQPWSGVLETIAQGGYTQVEGFGGVYADPKAFRADLDRNGLSMPTGHFSIDMLENELASALDIAGTFGMKIIICPFLMPDQRPGDAAGWRAFGARLAKVAGNCRKAGYDFAWHNHDFEFKKLPDGSAPQEHILDAAPEIGWEMDVAWVVRGGADPMEWLTDYGRRVTAVHVKDIAPKGEAADEDGWADVGHGTIDWKRLMAALRKDTPAKYYVMEHDKPNDYERFARRSIAAVKSY